MLLSLMGCSLVIDPLRHDWELQELADTLRDEVPAGTTVEASVEGPYSSNGCHLLATAVVQPSFAPKEASLAWVEGEEVVVQRGSSVERRPIDCLTCWTPGLRERLITGPEQHLAFLAAYEDAGGDWRCH